MPGRVLDIIWVDSAVEFKLPLSVCEAVAIIECQPTLPEIGLTQWLGLDQRVKHDGRFLRLGGKQEANCGLKARCRFFSASQTIDRKKKSSEPQSGYSQRLHR